MNVRGNLECLLEDLRECADNCAEYAKMGTRPEFYRGKAEAFCSAIRQIEQVMPIIVEKSKQQG